MSVTVHRNVGHPWSGEAGWDTLELRAVDATALALKISEAEGKHWQVWIVDGHRPDAIMYKPSGVTEPWRDDPRLGGCADICRAIKVGDWVYTDYAGGITKHQVTDRSAKMTCQYGVMLRVRPPIPGSAFKGDDGKVHNNAWLSCGWFRPDHLDIQ